MRFITLSSFSQTFEQEILFVEWYSSPHWFSRSSEEKHLNTLTTKMYSLQRMDNLSITIWNNFCLKFWKWTVCRKVVPNVLKQNVHHREVFTVAEEVLFVGLVNYKASCLTMSGSLTIWKSRPRSWYVHWTLCHSSEALLYEGLSATRLSHQMLFDGRTTIS